MIHDYFFGGRSMYRHEMVEPSQQLLKLIVHTNSFANGNVLRHWHQAIEIDYPIEGTADFTISGKRISSKSGDVLIINSNEIHSVDNMNANKNTLALTFLIPYEILIKEIPNYESYWFVLPKKREEVAIIKHDLYLYYQHSQIEDEYRNLQLKSDMFLILHDLLKYCSHDKNTVHGLPRIPTLHKLAKVIDYINQHSSEKIMLDEIAQAGHLSTGYLSRTFSKQMGMSVMEYVNYIRLKRAYEMITNTDKNIAVISDLTGFSNPKSFSKLFLQVYKQTPGKYRFRLKKS